MISLSESWVLRIWIIVLKKSQLWELLGWLSGSYSNSGRTRDYAMNVQTIIHCKNLEFKIFSNWLLFKFTLLKCGCWMQSYWNPLFPLKCWIQKDQINNIFVWIQTMGEPEITQGMCKQPLLRWMHGRLFVVTTALEKHELCHEFTRIDWILS